jgi:hypothetical protein
MICLKRYKWIKHFNQNGLKFYVREHKGTMYYDFDPLHLCIPVFATGWQFNQSCVISHDPLEWMPGHTTEVIPQEDPFASDIAL